MRIEDVTTYEQVSNSEIKEINSYARLLRHKKTGARVVLIENDDENKVFSIGFRTPPPDSTGVPHILEHSVLCGSDKYHVKDPFIELAKGSLNTFLNAFIYILLITTWADCPHIYTLHCTTLFYQMQEKLKNFSNYYNVFIIFLLYFNTDFSATYKFSVIIGKFYQ